LHGLSPAACVISEIRKLRKFVACVSFGWKPPFTLVGSNTHLRVPADQACLWRRLKMDDRIEQLLLHLQKELESANVQYNNVSTMARIGNSEACSVRAGSFNDFNVCLFAVGRYPAV